MQLENGQWSVRNKLTTGKETTINNAWPVNFNFLFLEEEVETKEIPLFLDHSFGFDFWYAE